MVSPETGLPSASMTLTMRYVSLSLPGVEMESSTMAFTRRRAMMCKTLKIKDAYSTALFRRPVADVRRDVRVVVRTTHEGCGAGGVGGRSRLVVEFFV